jgi:hypothetical protein
LTQSYFQENLAVESTSILLPSAAASPASIPYAAEILILGKRISRQLVGDDRSFTITLCSSGIFLSFPTAKCTVGKVQNGASLVHVQWLAPVTDIEVCQVHRERIIALESIPAGSELELECGMENFQAGFDLRWEQEVFSIRFETL